MNTESLEHNPVIREAVGIFDSPESLQAAIDDLEENGFMRQELSVLPGEKTVDSEVGEALPSEALADHADAPRRDFIPNEVLSEAEGVLIGIPVYIACAIAILVAVMAGGSLLEIVAAALLAGLGSAMIGIGIANIVAARYRRAIDTRLMRGGMVLWVALRAKEMQGKALRILHRHAGHHVHIHEIPVYGSETEPVIIPAAPETAGDKSLH